MMDVIALLKKHEGVRLKPYRDTEGKLTIGVGRNLDDVGITALEADELLLNDVDRCMKEIAVNFPWMADLDDVRIAVVISMIFNMGLSTFMGFRKTIQAIQSRDFETASKEMIDSKWYTQVGRRAHELSEMMRTGLYLNTEENTNGNSQN